MLKKKFHYDCNSFSPKIWPISASCILNVCYLVHTNSELLYLPSDLFLLSLCTNHSYFEQCFNNGFCLKDYFFSDINITAAASSA